MQRPQSRSLAGLCEEQQKVSVAEEEKEGDGAREAAEALPAGVRTGAFNQREGASRGFKAVEERDPTCFEKIPLALQCRTDQEGIRAAVGGPSGRPLQLIREAGRVPAAKVETSGWICCNLKIEPTGCVGSGGKESKKTLDSESHWGVGGWGGAVAVP